MFAYISGSPFVLQDDYGFSPQQYGLVFAVNAVGLVPPPSSAGDWSADSVREGC